MSHGKIASKGKMPLTVNKHLLNIAMANNHGKKLKFQSPPKILENIWKTEKAFGWGDSLGS